MSRARNRKGGRRDVRRAHRARRLQPNPLPVAAKLLLVSGITAAGGLAAYKLLKAPATSETPPTGPAPDPRAALAAQCADLESQLAALRSRPSPPLAEVRSLETQLQACNAQLREAGGAVDASSEARGTADAAHARMDGAFGEYKATDYSDALKRNNIRKDILQNGEAMAAQYAEAVTQATTPASAELARASIVRALDSAMTRRDCYANDAPGCGRLGVNEDHGADKAAAEQNRVINPLVAAYNAAAAKLGGPASSRIASNAAAYVNLYTRSASAAKDRADVAFTHYKATDYSDAVNRNDRRQSVLEAGARAAAYLQEAFAAASSHASRPGMRAVANAAQATLDAAISRWTCYINDAPGCGRFGVNEDHGFDKAAQERDRVIVPVAAVYQQAAAWLAARGDPSAYTALINTKLRLCNAIRQYIDAKFGEYKATDYSDAVKRNNLRQVVLSFGQSLAECLADAATVAAGGANEILAVLAMDAALRGSLLTGAIRFTGGQTQQTPPGVSGYAGFGYYSLGATAQATPQATAYQPMLMVATKARLPATMVYSGKVGTAAPAGGSTPSGPAPGAAGTAATIAALKAVGTATIAALDAATARRACYLFGEPGCGRFGVNEDHESDKAAHEQQRVIGPLVAVYDQIAQALIARGDKVAYAPLVTSKLRFCTRLKDRAEAAYSEFKATDYADILKRDNMRGIELGMGDALAACLRDALDTAVKAGPESVRAVVAVLRSALEQSASRAVCYRMAQGGCDRYWGSAETDGITKKDQEVQRVFAPLAGIYQQAVQFLARNGDTGAEAPLVEAQLRLPRALKDRIAAWNGERDATSDLDPIKRGNIHGEMQRAGGEMVDAVKQIRTSTAAGRALLRTFITQATTSPGAALAGVVDPLNAFLGQNPALGEVYVSSTAMTIAGWIGVGAIALVAGNMLLKKPKRPKRNAKRRARRTSRR